jgi:hypothetical protein
LASLKHLATVGDPEVAVCHLTDPLKQHGIQYFQFKEPGAKLEIEIYEWKPRYGSSRREIQGANECRALVPMNKHHVRTSVKEDLLNDMHEPAISGTTCEDFDESKTCLPDSGREKLGKCDVITSILSAKDAKAQVPEFISLSSIFSSRGETYGRNGVFKVETVFRSSDECYEYGHLVIADNGTTAINKTATRSNMNPGHVTGSPSCESVAPVIDYRTRGNNNTIEDRRHTERIITRSRIEGIREESRLKGFGSPYASTRSRDTILLGGKMLSLRRLEDQGPVVMSPDGVFLEIFPTG